MHEEFVPLSTLALTLATGGTMNTQQQSADASRSNSFPSKALDRGGSGFPVRASARNSARSCTTRDQSVGLDGAHCVIRTPYENNGSFFYIYTCNKVF